MSKKIIMLSGDVSSAPYMYNGLVKEFDIDCVVMEENPSARKFFGRRIKKLGLFKVLGQLLFQVIVVKILSSLSKSRQEEIRNDYALNGDEIPRDKLIRVPSVNSEECLHLLNTLGADIIVVNGTRIISKKILDGVNAIFLNAHAGITPKYRGVHGAYWALINKDRQNCGVTVHLVDKGIDTGGILYQENIEPTKRDNFTTYVVMQLGVAVKLMSRAIKDAEKGQLLIQSGRNAESRLWSHPTAWFYIYKRLTAGVK